MLEIDKKIIELLRNGSTLSKIKSQTGLYSSDLVGKIKGLESKGYLIHRLFYDYGVKFKILDKPITVLQDNVEILKNGNKVSFILLADTHVCNIYEEIEAIKLLYNYAKAKNIRYAIHLGDMIEGIPLSNHSNDRIKKFDIHDQVDFLTKNYPKDDKIDTLYILGNHDYRCLTEGIDISRVIGNRRLDMHFLGYKNSKLKIGNIDILLHHPFTIEKDKKYDEEIKDLYINPNFDVVYRGHTHHNSVYFNDIGSLVVNVPSYYNSSARGYLSAYEVTLKDDEMELNNLIVIGKEIYSFSVSKYPLKPKTLVKTPQSQIDKFNARINKSNAKKQAE